MTTVLINLTVNRNSMLIQGYLAAKARLYHTARLRYLQKPDGNAQGQMEEAGEMERLPRQHVNEHPVA